MEAVKGAAVAFAGGTDRGGIIGGYEPIHSSIQLYLVQIITIVVLCFVLGLMVKRLNQPRVIAEVWMSNVIDLLHVWDRSIGKDLWAFPYRHKSLSNDSRSLHQVMTSTVQS